MATHTARFPIRLLFLKGTHFWSMSNHKSLKDFSLQARRDSNMKSLGQSFNEVRTTTTPGLPSRPETIFMCAWCLIKPMKFRSA